MTDQQLVLGAAAAAALELQAAAEVNAPRALLSSLDRLLAQLQAVPDGAATLNSKLQFGAICNS